MGFRIAKSVHDEMLCIVNYLVNRHRDCDSLGGWSLECANNRLRKVVHILPHNRGCLGQENVFERDGPPASIGVVALTESYSPGKGKLWGLAGTAQYKSIGMALVEEKKMEKKNPPNFCLRLWCEETAFCPGLVPLNE